MPHAMLSLRQERELLRRAKRGNLNARNALIHAFGPYLGKITGRWHRKNRRLGERAEFYNEAVIGFCKAIRSFNLTKRSHLTTYARFHIENELKAYVFSRECVVKTVRYRAVRVADREYGREANPFRHSIVSLDEMESGENGLPLREVAGDGPTPEMLVIEGDSVLKMRLALLDALSLLPDRERRIIDARHLSESPKTLPELGAEFGVTKERARQLEKRAFQKLRILLADSPAREAL